MRDDLRAVIQIPTIESISGTHILFCSGEDCAKAYGDGSSPHFRQRYRTAATSWVILHECFRLSHHFERLCEVAIPLQRVPGQIEMGINDRSHNYPFGGKNGFAEFACAGK
jgi:hypothetical protein